MKNIFFSKERSCNEKKRYGKKSASRTARILGDMQGERDIIHSYPCDFGKHWHVGHIAVASIIPALDPEEVGIEKGHVIDLTTVDLFDWASSVRDKYSSDE